MTMKAHANIIGIGLLGLGTVGSGVVRLLGDVQERLLAKTGWRAEIKRILVRDPQKERRVQVSPALLTTSAQEVLEDPEVHVVVEVIGGVCEAREYVLRALQSGRHVITANKDLIAEYGEELQEVARRHGTLLFYEAAVAGAIPIIRTLKQSFSLVSLQEVLGIVNGTTNFILTKMAAERVSFAEALQEAQRLGYAEADPHADVSGLDAARKMSILASLAFDRVFTPADVRVEGITHLTQEDLERAAAEDQVIKLVGRAVRNGDRVEISVAPTPLPRSHPLAQVSGCYNAVYVYGDAFGETMYYGPGAGSLPTASAVIGDLFTLLVRQEAGEALDVVAG
jgi:homoserine dehydrogenase